MQEEPKHLKTRGRGVEGGGGRRVACLVAKLIDVLAINLTEEPFILVCVFISCVECCDNAEKCKVCVVP